MKTEKTNMRFGVLVLMILMAALSRLLPHPPNFAPIGAMALFGAAYFSNRIIAIVLPLIALWLSDLVLMNVVYAHLGDGFVFFYSGFYWIYGSFILITLLGFLTLKKVKVGNILGASLAASILFFITSNFSVFLGNMYPNTLDGLITCYIAAIPFFGNTLSGDLFYSGVLFGAFELAKRQFPVLQI